MLANIQMMLLFFGANYNDILVCVVLMTSTIIAAIGLLKPIAFDKIPNKQIRKAALAASNVAACFIAALIYFLVNDWNLDYYVTAALALSIWSIVTYWLYENTCLRNLIKLIGTLAINRIIKIVCLAATNDDVNAVKAELKKTGEELKSHTKTELKKAATTYKTDKDLKNL